MEVIDNTSNKPLKPCVATIGFFDGVHRGHQYLIEQVKQEAAARGMASAVVTFPVHPRKVMNTDYQPELLTTHPEKLELLARTGIDYCFILDFTPEVARLSAREFMAGILKNQYSISGLVIGYDHRFGHNRSETFDDYCRYGRELDINIVRARAYLTEGTAVSSSAIRRLLHAADISLANNYLNYNYTLEGTVTGGHQIGRTLGFPTANLSLSDPYKLIPHDGVYAVRVTVDGVIYGGMLNIGHRPTMDNGSCRSIEVHILDFDSDIYNFPIRIAFVQFVRAEMKFEGKEQLRRQLETDRVTVQRILDTGL